MLVTVAAALCLLTGCQDDDNGGDSGFPAAEDPMAGDVRTALGRRAAAAIETYQTSRSNELTGRLVCATHAVGADPIGITRAEDAKVAYVYASCEEFVDQGEGSPGASPKPS